MKKYKQLRKQLNEGEYMDGGVLGGFPVKNSTRSAHNDEGIFYVERDEQAKRIQAFLNAFTSREYLEPRAALSLLRLKLNLASLDFDFNNKTPVKIGSPVNFKLKRFGGTFGTSPEHDLTKGFEVTDGMGKGGSLSLVIIINESSSGLYKIEAKLVKNIETEDQELNQIEN